MKVMYNYVKVLIEWYQQVTVGNAFQNGRQNPMKSIYMVKIVTYEVWLQWRNVIGAQGYMAPNRSEF